jgi:hypothetical protein
MYVEAFQISISRMTDPIQYLGIINMFNEQDNRPLSFKAGVLPYFMQQTRFVISGWKIAGSNTMDRQIHRFGFILRLQLVQNMF